MYAFAVNDCCRSGGAGKVTCVSGVDATDYSKVQQRMVAEDVTFSSFLFLPFFHTHTLALKSLEVCECGLAPRFFFLLHGKSLSPPSSGTSFSSSYILSLSLSLRPSFRFLILSPRLFSHEQWAPGEPQKHRRAIVLRQQTDSPTNSSLLARLSMRVNPHGGGLSVRTYALYSSSLSCPTEAHLQRKRAERENRIGTV